MRTRLIAAALSCAVACIAITADAGARAHPGPRHRITIHAQPNPDVVGDPVVIYGRLIGPANGGRRVTLWHRLAGWPFFTPVETVRTEPGGYYDIARVAGVVDTNREWFVRSEGAQSRTVHEKVIAEVSASAPTSGDTDSPIGVTGRLTPNHPGERIVLQRQVGQNSDDWRTIDRAVIGDGSRYVIRHRFRIAGSYTLRTLFRGDRRNLRAASSSFDVLIEQAQNAALTLAATPDPIDAGQTVALAGTLAGAGAGQPVTLLARPYNTSGFEPVATTATGQGGGFSFSQEPQQNTVYRVRGSGRSSRPVFVAVRDVVTIAVSSDSGSSGQTVTFSGTVTPDKSGHPIDLQLLGNDGDYHAIQVTTVGSRSTYRFDHVLESPGTKQFRVRIDGGPVNAGAASAPVTVKVSPPPPTA